jgi:hypothetical protein
MMFCIGVIPMSVLASIAGSHLAWQVYELFLERGGEPIPLKPADADVPPLAYPMSSGVKPTAEMYRETEGYPTSPSSSASP